MSTINNDIPFVPENTTDPAAGLNQSLNVIDALLQIAVLGIQSAPPGSPTEGDRYIVSPTGTAEWAGHDNQLARWQNGAWNFYDARIAVNLGDSRIYSFDGTAWTDPAGGGITALQPGDNVSWLVNDVPYVETVNGETGPNAVLDADDIDDTATTNKFATQAQLDAADGALQAVNNLLDVADAPTARTNLGLGTAATSNADDFATGAEGDLAATALQPSGNLAGLASNATARANLGLGTFAIYNYSSAPFVNRLLDSGRFAGAVDPMALTIAATYQNSAFFGSYNGSSFSESGKFIHNNTTHGGTAGALSATANGLITHLGSVTGRSLRYGAEFYLSRITSGSGTAGSQVGADSITRYLATINPQWVISGAGSYCTFAAWVNVGSGSAHLGAEYYLDGVLVATRTPIPAGWHHVRIAIALGTGYDNSMPRIYATSSSTIDVALPCLFTGLVDTGMHNSPLATNG